MPFTNDVGGSTSGISDVHRLRRFLCFGSETGSFVVEEKELSPDNVKSLVSLIEAGHGEEVVDEIVKVSTEGKSAKKLPCIYALAVCARLTKDLKTKQAAYKALHLVCPTTESLFQFVVYVEKMVEKSTGWGRAQRKGISNWYYAKDPLKLAVEVTRFRERKRWSHLDLLRLAHVKPQNEAVGVILKYIRKGVEQTKAEFANAGDNVAAITAYLEGVEAVKSSRDEEQVSRLVEQHKLYWEHIPTWMHNSKEVWRALIQHMSLGELVAVMDKLAILNLLDPLSANSCAPLVVERLQNDQLVQESKIHPFTVLVAMKTYEKGKEKKGKKSEWKPNLAVVDALSHAFYAAFKNVEPTNKRYLLAMDVSGSMQYGGVNGTSQITPAIAMSAMALLTANTEENYDMVAFSDSITSVKLKPDMTLQEVQHAISEVKMGGIDLSKPVAWAEKNNKAVDVFLVYTDCETCSDSGDTLKMYREKMKVPDAKMVVCALTSNDVAMGVSEDPRMLGVAGFNAATPDAIRRFIMGEL